MKINFIDAVGGGCTKPMTVAEDISVEAAFHAHKGIAANITDYVIMVNGLSVAADDRLSEGDTLSITPVNVKGA